MRQSEGDWSHVRRTKKTKSLDEREAIISVDFIFSLESNFSLERKCLIVHVNSI